MISRRRFTGGLAAGIAAPSIWSGSGFAQERRVRVNQEYRLIEQQPVESGDRVEVIDFFWYGCPFCNELQPALEDWLKRKPADVQFRRMPVILKDNWAPHARIYFTLEAVGAAERLHLKVYHSYHVEELHMSKPDVMSAWAVKNGIDRKAWDDAYGSRDVDRKVIQAREATRAYNVQGTPSLVVDGRFITSSGMVDTVRGVIPVLDELIRLAREQRARR